MLYDNRPHIKELTLKRIIAARKSQQSGIRILKVPKLNYDAKDYTDMIVWSELQVTSPSILRDISDIELENLLASDLPIMVELPD